VPLSLRIVTAVVALAVAAGAGVAAARNRPPTRGTLLGTVAIFLCACALVGSAIVSITDGKRAPSMATFVGYLVAFLVIPAAGWALARLEPTRWGSVIIAATGVVEAILVVRLDQVWTGL
jgi:hypothetical protein